MLRILFTLDYEIHGNGEGCPYELMVQPTNRMFDQFDQYGAKLTIFADVAEILKFKEYYDKTGDDKYYSNAIENQLQDAIRRGHDVQLHLHPAFFNAKHSKNGWEQDWAEYDFASLPPHRLEKIVNQGKQYLENLLRPVSSDYRCYAFRAANWAMVPSRNAVRALIKNGIRIDSSVFKYGKRKGLVNFDYRYAHSQYAAWPVDEEDICKKDDCGKLIEVPIYSENRWIGAFLSSNRFIRAAMSRAHRMPASRQKSQSMFPDKLRKTISKFINIAFRRHAWKADFNQCTSRQLISALKRALKMHTPRNDSECFVLIGHSKLFSEMNERNLVHFLKYVAAKSDTISFGTFHNKI